MGTAKGSTDHRLVLLHPGMKCHSPLTAEFGSIALPRQYDRGELLPRSGGSH